MADAKTGELRHRDHWYSGKEIDLRAEISDRTRKPLMKELALVGLVRWERERIRRVLRDRLTGRQRMRCVSGRTKYFVLKSPHKDWFSYSFDQDSRHKDSGSSEVQVSQTLKSCNTLNRIKRQYPKSPRGKQFPSKVKFLHGARFSPASLSVNHQDAEFGVSRDFLQPQRSVNVSGQSELGTIPGVPTDRYISGDKVSPSSSVSENTSVKKIDDNDNDRPDRVEALLKKAITILICRGHEPDYVEIALNWIDQRSFEVGTAPGSVTYYLKSFETLEGSPTEKDLVWDHVKKRRARYLRFGIPIDITTLQLTSEQEKARQLFNQRLRARKEERDLPLPSKSDLT